MVTNMISQQNFSAEQKAIVFDYYQLASQQKLSNEDVSRISTIWKNAANDAALTQALIFIDNFISAGSSEPSPDDTDLRTFLCEHISVIVEGKLKEQDENAEERHSPGHTNLLCPDGSGIVSITSTSNELVSLGEMSEKLCEKCNFKLSEHIVLQERPVTSHRQ